MAALLRYLPIIIALVLLVAAVVDIVRIDPSRVRALPKGLWVVIAIAIVIIGPILWFALGREPLEPRDHGRYRCRLCWEARHQRPRKTTCRQGHPLTEDNLYRWTDASGFEHSRCRQCQIDRQHAYRQRQKENR